MYRCCQACKLVRIPSSQLQRPDPRLVLVTSLLLLLLTRWHATQLAGDDGYADSVNEGMVTMMLTMVMTMAKMMMPMIMTIRLIILTTMVVVVCGGGDGGGGGGGGGGGAGAGAAGAGAGAIVQVQVHAHRSTRITPSHRKKKTKARNQDHEQSSAMCEVQNGPLLSEKKLRMSPRPHRVVLNPVGFVPRRCFGRLQASPCERLSGKLLLLKVV